MARSNSTISGVQQDAGFTRDGEGLDYEGEGGGGGATLLGLLR